MKNFFDYVDDYVAGHLPQNLRNEMEGEMLINPSLRRRVTLCQEMSQAITNPNESSLRQKLKASQRNYNKQKQSKARITFWAVASVAVLIGLFFAIYPPANSNQKLFEAHFSPYMANAATRTSSHFEHTTLSEEALNLYAGQRYEMVIPLLEQQLRENPKNEEVILLLSSAYLATKNAQQAHSILVRAITYESNLWFNETAKWYLSLSLLKLNKKEEVKILLREIVSDKGFYSARANALLGSL
jgi:tetratricopeptide (TPR) repeat protein